MDEEKKTKSYPAKTVASHEWPFMPIVYISSPYRGEREKNTENACLYSRVALNKGYIPFVPHLLYPQFMDEDKERSKALYMGLVMLDKCTEVWVFGERISDGMKAELERAGKRHKRVRYFTADGEEKNE